MSLTARIYRERRAVALPVILFLLANIAVLALVVLPLRRSVVSAQTAANDAMMKLNLARGEDRRARDISTSKDRAETELKKFYAEILPRDFITARNLVQFWLQKTADATRLKWSTGAFDYDPVRQSSLVRVTGKVTLSGDYADIRRFLYALETAQEFIIIENVMLSQSQLEKGVTNSRAGISVELDVSTYYLGGVAGGNR